MEVPSRIGTASSDLDWTSRKFHMVELTVMEYIMRRIKTSLLAMLNQIKCVFNTFTGRVYTNTRKQGSWPGSALKITSAMSLNEIVNCPTQFASSSPYLVVQHIDWIQCRYLFVQVSATDSGYGGASSNVSQ
jgi:hypothetical protein